MPIDVMSNQTSVAARARDNFEEQPGVSADVMSQVASMFLAAKNPGIVAGDDVAVAGAVGKLVTLSENTGALVYHEGARAQVPVSAVTPFVIQDEGRARRLGGAVSVQ